MPFPEEQRPEDKALPPRSEGQMPRSPEDSGAMEIEVLAFVEYCKDLEKATQEGKRDDALGNKKTIEVEIARCISEAHRKREVDEKEETELWEKMNKYFDLVKDSDEHTSRYREEFLNTLNLFINKGKGGLSLLGASVRKFTTRTLERVEATIEASPVGPTTLRKKLEGILDRMIETSSTETDVMAALRNEFREAIVTDGIFQRLSEEHRKLIFQNIAKLTIGGDETKLRKARAEIMQTLEAYLSDTPVVITDTDMVINIGNIMGGELKPNYMTWQEVLEYLQIGEVELSRLVSNAELKGIKVGNAIKFKKEWVEQYKASTELPSVINLPQEDDEEEVNLYAARTFMDLGSDERTDAFMNTLRANDEPALDFGESDEGTVEEDSEGYGEDQPEEDADEETQPEEDAIRALEPFAAPEIGGGRVEASSEGKKEEVKRPDSGRFGSDPDLALLEREVYRLENKIKDKDLEIQLNQESLKKLNELKNEKEWTSNRRFKGIIAVGLLALLTGATSVYLYLTDRQKQELLDTKEGELRKALANIDGLETENKGLEAENKGLHSSILKMQRELDDASETIRDMEKEMDKARTDLKTALAKAAQLKEDLRNLANGSSEEKDRLNQQLSAKIAELTQLQAQLDTLRVDAAQATERSRQVEASLRADLAEQNTRYEAMVAAANALRIQVEELNRQPADPAAADAQRIAALRDEIAEKTQLLATLRTQMDQQAQTLTENVQTMDALRSEKDSLNVQLATLRTQMDQQAQTLTENVQTMDALRSERGALTTERDALNIQLETLQKQIDQLTLLIETLGTERELLNQQLILERTTFGEQTERLLESNTALSAEVAENNLEMAEKQAELDRLRRLDPNIHGDQRHVQLINKFRARQPLNDEEKQFLIGYYEETVNKLRNGYGEFLRETNAEYQRASAQNSAEYQSAMDGNEDIQEIQTARDLYIANHQRYSDAHREAFRRYEAESEEATRELQLLRSLR